MAVFVQKIHHFETSAFFFRRLWKTSRFFIVTLQAIREGEESYTSTFLNAYTPKRE